MLWPGRRVFGRDIGDADERAGPRVSERPDTATSGPIDKIA